MFVAAALLLAAPPSAPPEFRGVWVATVANIDWPSKPGLPAEQQKKELVHIFDTMKELNLNAAVFQVRPMCDALYESKLEPWSVVLTGTSGQSPGYDPLALAIELAHARGIELHAWLNPYRAWSPSAKLDPAATHLIKTRPDMAKQYGKHYWLNPTHPDVQAHSLAVAKDIVTRYKVDGIHMDDYFYPYSEKDAAGVEIPFPDDDTWETYTKGGGKLERDDWRRAAVDSFVQKLYVETHRANPKVKVGISPFGIWRPGHPPGIQGFDQYARLYADAKKWLNEGWVDYYTPQLYWPIAPEKQSFPKLYGWWAAENTKGRHLWPGIATYKLDAKEIGNQIDLTRGAEPKVPASGVVHFSMKAILTNKGGIVDELKKRYPTPAAVPACPWLAH